MFLLRECGWVNCGFWFKRTIKANGRCFCPEPWRTDRRLSRRTSDVSLVEGLLRVTLWSPAPFNLHLVHSHCMWKLDTDILIWCSYFKRVFLPLHPPLGSWISVVNLLIVSTWHWFYEHPYCTDSGILLVYQMYFDCLKTLLNNNQQEVFKRLKTQ